MIQSLARLLDGAMDYAGLFPPASLDIDGAWKTFLRHRSGPESAWLGRFACPASGLAGLAEKLAAHEGPPVRVSVIGRSAEGFAAWQDARVADATDMTAFELAVGQTASIEAYESRLPSGSELPRAVRDLKQFDGIEVYAEIPWECDVDEALDLILDAEPLRAKVRTGGATASAVPSAEQLAGFLHTCLNLEIPAKLTAGLHHPWPHEDATIGATTHGFMNAFGGAAIALAHDLSRHELAELLADAAPVSWDLGPTQLRYRDLVATLDDIDAARATLVSFGTCSIDEPWEFLAQRGWVDAEAVR